MKTTPERFPITPEVRRIGQAVRDAGGRALLVGGWVRDCLLDIPHSKDFDVEVYGLAPRRLQRLLARFGPVHTVGRHFGVLKLATDTAEYDVSVPRRESKIGKGHREFQVKPDPGMTFEEAAYRRDFTINSMGYDFLAGRVLDPYGGLDDLERRILRHVGPAFGEDPLRVLRALQFAGRFELTIPPETLAICREQDLSELPRERVWEEFRKLLLHAQFPSHGLRWAGPLGALPYFPELKGLAGLSPLPPGVAPAGAPRPATDGWAATQGVVDAAARERTGEEKADIVLMLAALGLRFGEVAPPAAHRQADGVPDPFAATEWTLRTFLARLTRSAAVVEGVVRLAREWPTPERLYAARHDPGSNGAVRRLALRCEVPAVLRLVRAEYRVREALGARAPLAAADWLEARARALGVWEGPPVPLLRGRDLLDAGVPAGRHMGRLLDRVFERQLDGELTTVAEAREWALREWNGPPGRRNAARSSVQA